MEITIILPVLNEEKALRRLLPEIRELGYTILAIDGYSKDGSVQLCKDAGAKVIQQSGKGKAGAIISAIAHVETEYLLIMDSDYTYDPSDIQRFTFDADEVLGYRTGENISGIHRLGNWILTKTFNATFGSNIPDVASGMYLLKTSKAKKLHLESHGFVIDQEILAQMLPNVKTVPISYRKRIGKPKTTTWRQGFRALWTIFDLARKYNSALLFSFLASLCLIPAFALLGLGLYDYFFASFYHSGYFFASILFFVLGSQGVTVATMTAILKRIEAKLP